MEISWDTRPPSLSIHKPRGWDSVQNGVSSSSATATSLLMSRRRSTAAHAPPPGPPPTQPIPSPPFAQPYETYDGLPNMSGPMFDLQNRSYSPPQTYARPAASANLAAVAAFSQARHVQYSPATTASSSTENLSDSPPPPRLRSNTMPPPETSEIVPERLLLSPPEPRTSEPRPSSRRALTKALELAREAVKLDSTNDDPYGAVVAYGKSVALLSEVMERVMRGEDSTEGRRQNGRRRSVVAQEEEVRRLKSIHDTYADRMNILSVIYSIPLPTNSPPSTYASSSFSASTTSSQPSSPASTSPTSDTFSQSRSLSRQNSGELNPASGPFIDVTETQEDMIEIGTAVFSLDGSGSAGNFSPRTPVAPAPHPYAAVPASSISIPIRTPTLSPPRPQIGRPRASSTLPPLAPPPTSLPPPAPRPSSVEPPQEPSPARTLRPPDVPSRQRGISVSHKRTGSAGRLASLPEELEKPSAHRQPNETLKIPAITDEAGRSRSRSSQREAERETHPLPPLPSPARVESTTSSMQYNGTVSPEAQSPRGSMILGPRPRGGSTFSVKSEASTSSSRDLAPLINSSPTLGTISKRRNKTSAPPSMASSASSPTESTSSSASVPTMSRLPPSTVANSAVMSLAMSGRSRASSQPGRRPSVAANAYPFPPQSAAPTGSGMMQSRKVPIPSRLNPNAPPQITINTALLSPPLSKSIFTALVPPPPIPHGNLPVAPMSPLPPSAPTDPLRKPYHMMTLLRQTMTSKTGGYITRRLHVPQEVWSQGGAKLMNIPEKIRVVEVLCSALEEIQNWSVEYFGAGNVSSGLAMGIGSIGKKEAELWASKLEDFSSVCDGVVSNFGKKLGVGEGFVTKKTSGVTSWGGRLTRQFDKLTNAKNLDSPAVYVQGLSKLFNHVQILDEHTKAVSSQPIAPLYAAFPLDLRIALEVKLRRYSEFFAKVVLTFVIHDMALLLDKYVKKCEKWLAE